jgi:membrane protein
MGDDGGLEYLTHEEERALARFDRASVDAFDAVAAGATKGVRSKVLAFAQRRRWRWLGRALQVQYRFAELRGGDLASSVTTQSFLAIFPLALVAIAVLGYLNANSTDFASHVVDNLGLHGEAARTVTQALDTASHSRRASTVIGLVGLAWSGLGLANAFRSAYDRAWQVETRGVRDRATSVLWLVGAGLIFAVSLGVTTLLQFLPAVLAPLGIVFAVLVSFGLFLWTARVLADVGIPLRALVPGALVGAIGFEVLKAVGAYVVPRLVASSSTLYGTLGIVFALLAWLLFFGRLVVYTAVIDVVLYEARHGTIASTVQLPHHARATRRANRAGMALPVAAVERRDQAPRGPCGDSTP